MGRIKASFLFVVLSTLALLPRGSPSNVVPAFLWSSHHNGPLQSGVRETIDYRRILPMELARFVLYEGGWLNHVCSEEKQDLDVDVALVFLGKKLQTSDLSRKTFVDQSLIDVLELSFTSSNFSMAFPYVIKSNEEKIENSIISGFSESCGSGLQRKQIAVSEACSVEGGDFTKLTDLSSVQDHMGKVNVIIYCTDRSVEAEEGEVLAKLIGSMEKSGARYSVLYASDPPQLEHGMQMIPYRSLVEVSKNASVNSKACDGVCKIKSSLLEGVFVAIVLLVILLSGLCCMMGIDTPTRFETPQES